MKYRKLVSVVLVAAIVTTSVSSATAQDDSELPQDGPAGVDFPAPEPEDEPQPWTKGGVELYGTSCEHTGRSDNPHYSSGDASAHGWWLPLNAHCPSRADVWVRLEMLSCYYVVGVCAYVYWRNMAQTEPVQVRPGSGKGRWVNVRWTCENNLRARWRAVVDVDIPNERDGKEKYYSPSVILRCNNDL